MNIHYTQEHRERIDTFLTKELSISRNKAQKMLESGAVLVNDKKVTKHHALLLNDIISVHDETLEKATEVRSFEPNKDVPVEVVFEDDNYLIINKQTGLLIHPTEKMENDTLSNWLIATYPSIKEVGDDPLRPGIVHRLDKNVSGLLLVAKNQTSFDYYKELFKSRDITKIYTALVHGVMDQPHDDITMRISRSKSKGKMSAHPQDSELGKDAKTEYDVVKQFKNITLLKVRIHTGRTHQIRVHLNAIEHPIVGDPLYKQRYVKQKLNFNRPFLHATSLSFVNQEGEEVTYEAPLPQDLQTLLDRID